MLTKKWTPMNASVQKFNQLVSETLAHSGEKDEDWITRVEILYKTHVTRWSVRRKVEDLKFGMIEKLLHLTKEHIEGHSFALRSIIKDHNRKNKTNPIQLDFDEEDTMAKDTSIVKRKEVVDDDLGKPFKEALKTPLTRRHIEFIGPKYKMPTNIKLYDGTTDPEDFLGHFASATNSREWPLPVWCRMFQQTLDGPARGNEVFLDVREKIVKKEVSTADLVTTVGEVVTAAIVEDSFALATATTADVDDELTLEKTLISIKEAKPKVISTTIATPRAKGVAAVVGFGGGEVMMVWMDDGSGGYDDSAEMALLGCIQSTGSTRMYRDLSLRTSGPK
nr:reverse transcriptase domain-containing protein [Tanacetum cinerariifolium]